MNTWLPHFLCFHNRPRDGVTAKPSGTCSGNLCSSSASILVAIQIYIEVDFNQVARIVTCAKMAVKSGFKTMFDKLLFPPTQLIPIRTLPTIKVTMSLSVLLNYINHGLQL